MCAYTLKRKEDANETLFKSLYIFIKQSLLNITPFFRIISYFTIHISEANSYLENIPNIIPNELIVYNIYYYLTEFLTDTKKN